MGAAQRLVSAPSSSPSDFEPAAPTPPRPAATMTVSADGVIRSASREMLAWWGQTSADAIVGRPFVSLFFFEAPESRGDPVGEAWRLLEAAAVVRPLTLQARVAGGGFEAVVTLTQGTEQSEDAGSGSGETVPHYVARIERADPAATEVVPPAASRATDATSDPVRTVSPSSEVPERQRPAPEPLADFVAPDATMQPPPAAPTPAPPVNPAVRDDGPARREPANTSAGTDQPMADEPRLEALEKEERDRVDGMDDVIAGSAVEPDEGGLAEELEPDLHLSGWGLQAPRVAVPADWSIWDGGNVGLFELDFERGIARYSASWARLLGYGEDDVADELDTLGSLFHPDDSEAAPGPETRGRRGARVPYTAEVRLRAKDGSWRWVQLEGVQTFGADGYLAHLAGVMLDVQERHELEEDLGRTEARFRQLVGRGRYGFFELDLVEDSGHFSPEFRHALGYAGPEPAATPDGFLRFLAPDDAEAGIDAFFNAADEGGAGLTRRLRLRHQDGRDLDFDVVLGIQRNRRREIQRVTGLLAPALGGEPDSDAPRVTETAAAPTATEKLAEAARLALDAVGEAVVLTDESGCINHANIRAIQWTGGDPERIVAKPVHEVFPLVDRANGVPAPEVVRRVLEGGSPLELDHRYALLDPSGDRADLVITCRALHDVRKRVAGGILILRKPSEMPLSPAELVASNRMETLGRLACGIAHDFNNILTTVTGAISIALDRRQFDALHPAQKALDTARNLARQLLTFARGDSSERKVQSVNDVIRETARLTSAGSKSRIELELADDLHPVNLDSVRMVQVFTNLILNAMQVMPDGGRIWVRTQNMRLGPVNSVALSAGDYVRVEVQDDGPGIPAENLEHIFEPFFSMRSGGTGLGLAMVRSIITQHEGAIEVVSTVGTGTTFTIYLPRATQETVKETAKPMTVAYGSGRVLVMDDDVDLCMIAKGMLEVLGYEADTATSADAAIAAVRKYRDMGRRYTAVILDLTMAGGPGGEDVLPRLREIDPEIVAIVSSGYATDEHVERYRKLGFKGMLAKPYRSGDLGRALKEVLAAGR